MSEPYFTFGNLAELERRRKQEEAEERARMAEKAEAKKTVPPSLGAQIDAQTDAQTGVTLGAQTPKQAPKSERPERPALGAQPKPIGRPKKPALGAQSPASWSERYGEPYFPSRQLKGRLSLRLSIDCLDALEAFCRQHGCDKGDVVEHALAQFLGAQRETIGRPKKKPLGAQSDWAPNHDRKDLIDDDEIIIIYRELTENRPTARDRAAAEEIREIPPEIVRQGIALTLKRAPTKVNSLRYCLGAIREVAEASARPSPPVHVGPKAVDPPTVGTEAPAVDRVQFRYMAARLVERHRESGYSISQLRHDLVVALEAQGTVLDEGTIEWSLDPYREALGKSR
jgi:hypothetical protein